MDNENTLITEALSGNNAAFNQLAKLYIDKIYWHARRMLGNHIDADEVTQEVLIVMYQKLQSFKQESSLYTWIYKITSTRCLNTLRKRNLKRFIFFDDIGDITDNGKAEADLINKIENKEKLKRIDNVLQTLPSKQREIFILRHYDDLTYEEIAKITGKKVGTLKANYFHALNKVMERI
ncbi:MAG: RNA polymerase sigma factor [bacterium]